jgi:class 3 adenylate cyclase
MGTRAIHFVRRPFDGRPKCGRWLVIAIVVSMARRSVHTDIADSIDRTLREEARGAELMLASVRTLALVLVTGLDTLLYLFPARAGWVRLSASLPLVAVAWCAGAAGLTVALRGGFYRPWLRWLIPLSDAALIYLTFAIAWGAAQNGDDELRRGLLVVWTVTAGLLAASGGLRLRPWAPMWTTFLAAVVFVAITAPATHPVWIVYGLAMLSCVGALAMWMMQVMRRTLRSEISRVTLQRFLPDRVLETSHDPMALLSDPRSLDATILVSDLRGFTSLVETMAPAETLELLNEIQGAFARAVRNEGGTVDKYLGDGMLAVFGAPEPMEDHAGRAVEAAIGMRQALETVNEKRRGRGQPLLKMGIGIHSGAVVTGCLGSGAHLEFTVIGDTVNTTSRLESVSKEKGVDVIVSEETASRIAQHSGTQELSILERLGEVPIRGRKEPLVVHRLLGGG